MESSVPANLAVDANDEVQQPSQQPVLPDNALDDSSVAAETDGDASHPFYEADMPLLVNRDHYIPEGYDPDLAPIGNEYYLNRKAAAAWTEMHAAAEMDGIDLRVVSAYRSHERQEQNFNNKVAEHVAAGRSNEEAHVLAAAYIAVPGTSEHTLGLAVDINSLYESFEHSKEFAWLKKNCAKFGFILRYPKDKTDITKISYEPWHYRYVGINHATVIMEKGICLEEYLDE